jgi:hypothetical protein
MKAIALVAMLATLASSSASAQATLEPDTWRVFAQQVDVGTRLEIRLDDGHRIVATLIQAGPDSLVVQPRTRVPVPLQRITYDRIASIERNPSGGVGAGKAIAIGVASGVGAFLGTLLILIASMD